MPVIKKSEEEYRYILLKGNINKRMEAQQLTDKQMGGYIGVAGDTFKRKRNHPELFKYPELMKVFKKLNFPDNEIMEVMKLEQRRS